MDLQEVMARFGGHAERLPDPQIKSGKEIDLTELMKVFDAWQPIWSKLDPRTVDQRRHREQRCLQQESAQYANIIKGMTFEFKVLEGYSKEFVRLHLLRENPGQEKIVNYLFDQGSWWRLVARVRATNGSDYLDFCHANTREVVRIKISADSPIIDHYELAGPVAPRGSVVLF